MTSRYRANFLYGTITGNFTAIQTTVTGVGFPSSIPANTYLPIILSPGYYGTTASGEIAYVTNIVGGVATITRGQEGTTAASGTSGAAWVAGPLASDFTLANNIANGDFPAPSASGQLFISTSTTSGQFQSNIPTGVTITDLNASGTNTLSGTVAFAATTNFNNTTTFNNTTNLYGTTTVNNITATGTNTISGTNNIGGTTTFSGTVSAPAGITATGGTLTDTVFTAPIETITVSGVTLSAVTPAALSATNSLLYFYSANPTSAFAVNLTNVPNTPGQSVTFTFGVVNGSTAYLPSAITINGYNTAATGLPTQGQVYTSTITTTTYYQGGVAWTAADASHPDFYSISILCTASNTYTMLIGVTKY